MQLSIRQLLIHRAQFLLFLIYIAWYAEFFQVLGSRTSGLYFFTALTCPYVFSLPTVLINLLTRWLYEHQDLPGLNLSEIFPLLCPSLTSTILTQFYPHLSLRSKTLPLFLFPWMLSDNLIVSCIFSFFLPGAVKKKVTAESWRVENDKNLLGI